jgi:uncharacterized protein DUF3455
MNSNARQNRTTLRMPIACVTALAVALLVALAQPAHADHRLRPPRVPAKLEVGVGNTVFLISHAIGTQNYVCLPSAAGFGWSLFTPQAVLFDDQQQQLITHFFSVNPSDGLVRPAWQHSRDTSRVWVSLVDQATRATDPEFVAPGAIAWLLLRMAGTEEGPTGGRTLADTTYIQRVNTAGGVMPATGCSQSSDVGKRAFVPYEADYVFYKDRGHGDDDD